MRTQPCFLSVRIGASPLRLLAALGALLVGFNSLAAVQASVTQVYTFEEGNDHGFGNNFSAPEGVNNEVALDTIGATEGTGSLKFSLVQEEFFAGVLTGQLDAAINDPPGVEFVLFDLTIPDAFVGPGFARAGITIFASHPEFGALQAQFMANEVPLDNLPAGTHQIRINVSSAIQFNGKSFNELIGPIEDPTQIQPTGFQIYINKSITVPFTVYFDNIRVGEYDADFNNDTNVNGLDFNQWKANFGTGTAADADGDGDSDGQDFLVWQQQFGATGLSVATGVPEPITTTLLGTVFAAIAAARRARCRRA